MTGYAITNSEKTVWVCKDKSGAYSLTTDKGKAVIFDTKPSADTVFKSNLSKLIKSKGVEVKAVTLQISGADVKPVKEVAVTKEVAATHTDISSSKHIISILTDAAAKLNCRHAELVEEESRYDREKTDVEHYIELNAGKLNAFEGYKAYKLLQDILLKRRKVKDEIQILNVVRDKMAITDDIESINERVSELESRSYTPRELHYLFKKE